MGKIQNTDRDLTIMKNLVQQVSAEKRTGGISTYNIAVSRETLVDELTVGFGEKAYNNVIEDKGDGIKSQSPHDLAEKDIHEVIDVIDTVEPATSFYVMGPDAWAYYQKVDQNVYLKVRDWSQERLLLETRGVFLPDGIRQEVADRLKVSIDTAFHRMFDQAVKELADAANTSSHIEPV